MKTKVVKIDRYTYGPLSRDGYGYQCPVYIKKIGLRYCLVRKKDNQVLFASWRLKKYRRYKVALVEINPYSYRYTHIVLRAYIGDKKKDIIEFRYDRFIG